MNVAPWVHWYMAAFFVLFGAILIAKRRRLADACTLVPRICGDDLAQERLHRALEQRSSAEAISTSLGVGVGLCSIALGVLAVFPWAPVVLLYAFMTLSLAFDLVRTYVRMRGAGRRRAASLVARRPWLVVPWYVFVLAFVAVLSPLVTVRGADFTGAIVAVSGLLILITAWNVASLPALLIGEDPVVERFVDERLRLVRTLNLIATSNAPAVVFFGFSIQHISPATGLAEAYVCVLLCVFVWWQYRLTNRAPSNDEVAAWAALA